MLVGGVGVTAAVAAIDLLLGIQEQGGPGHVVIKIEYVQVHTAHVERADQNKIPGQLSKLFVETNNLLVKPAAVGSVVSPKNDEQELGFSACNLFRLLVIGVPQRPVPLRCGEKGTREDKEDDSDKPPFHEAECPPWASGGRQPPDFYTHQ